MGILGDEEPDEALEEEEIVDPSRAYFKADLKANDSGGAEAVHALVPAPLVQSPLAGISTDEGCQKVIQLCLGEGHGILLTDMGLAYTWGDNRYGQLGRKPELKEEEDKPFVVKALENLEIKQVASGKHHCLALTAEGLVWAWGRNKKGQLGCGDKRDRIEPVWVREKKDQCDAKNYPQLCNIQAIGAGGVSSVAAAKPAREEGDARIYQWGEMNEEVGGAAHGDYPYQVFKSSEFRAGLRKGKEGAAKVSISEQGCSLQTTQHGDVDIRRVDVKDTMETIQNLYLSITNSRKELNNIQEKQEALARKKRESGAGDGNELNDLADTSAQLERDCAEWEAQIQLLDKNMKSCKQQAEHNRRQLQTLEHQGRVLGESSDHMGFTMIDAKGPEKKRMEEKINEIKEFQEANQNTRMTLLDQRAEIDKEKQTLTSKYNHAKAEKEKMEKRLKLVNEMSEATTSLVGASSQALQRVSEELKEVKEYYESKPTTLCKDFVEVMQNVERDKKFLDERKARLAELREVEKDEPQRADMLKGMMSEIIHLHRRTSELLTHQWSRNDLDLSAFFDGARKPTDPQDEEDAKKS